jgi:uncharacterized LabA/DUF88 family protein
LINTLQENTESRNAIVYVNYENIFDLLKLHGKDPQEMDFFQVIHDRLKASGLKLIDFTIFGDFEKKPINSHQQSLLRKMGFQTRHIVNKGKNSSDLELTVNALRDLYKNPIINVFVIISGDEDIVPLLKEIKFECKYSYIISAKNGFNPIIAQFADFHEYIEDIFNLDPSGLAVVTPEPDGVSETINPAAFGPADILHAREVSHYFYNSQIWTRAALSGKPVTLNGYLPVIAKVVHRNSEVLSNDFKLAHALKYITVYQDSVRGLCIKEGEAMGLVVGNPSL